MKKALFSILLIAIIFFAISCSKEKLLDELIDSKGGSGATISATTCGCGSLPATSLTKNVVTDFGAIANDGNDDTYAFLRAAEWLRITSTATVAANLYIPTGTYQVGIQFPGSTLSITVPAPYSHVINNPYPNCCTRWGPDIFNFKGEKNIFIYGDGASSIVKYNNGLYYGGWTSSLTPATYYPPGVSCPPTGNVCDRAFIGDFIKILPGTGGVASSCISVSKLKVDGNNSSLFSNGFIGGYYGDCNSFVLDHDGLLINSSSNISITDVQLNNFCRDGILTMHSGTTPPTCVNLTNVLSIANSRQGISFGAGNNFTVSNSQFSKTGTVFYSNPGCGMDIEPEWGVPCSNSTFTNCKFSDNTFCGMISDNHPGMVTAMTFSSCEFSASINGSVSIWPHRMSSTVFSNCTIRGTVNHVTGMSSTDRLKFTTCLITDWNGGAPIAGWGNYLLNMGGTVITNNNYFEFTGCTFDLRKSALIYLDPLSSGYDRIFNDNRFNFYWSSLSTSTWTYTECPLPFTHTFFGRIWNSTLKGNVFKDMNPSATPIPANASRWAFMAETSPVNVLAGDNTFLPPNTSTTQYNHFYRRVSVWTCGLSNSTF